MSSTQLFSYKDVHGTPRPIIPIRLLKKNYSTRVQVLVDSGADVCVFWGEVGESLGIDVRSGEPHQFGGIGSQKPQMGYWHQIGLKVGQETINATVLFSYDIRDDLAIAGQKDFFESFEVSFQYSQRRVRLKRDT